MGILEWGASFAQDPAHKVGAPILWYALAILGTTWLLVKFLAGRGNNRLAGGAQAGGIDCRELRLGGQDALGA